MRMRKIPRGSLHGKQFSREVQSSRARYSKVPLGTLSSRTHWPPHRTTCNLPKALKQPPEHSNAAGQSKQLRDPSKYYSGNARVRRCPGKNEYFTSLPKANLRYVWLCSARFFAALSPFRPSLRYLWTNGLVRCKELRCIPYKPEYTYNTSFTSV